jgi:hypothetical protein
MSSGCGSGAPGTPRRKGFSVGISRAVATVNLPHDGSFELSLAGRADEVEFGLPGEYRAAVTSGPSASVEVAIAAHARRSTATDGGGNSVTLSASVSANVTG